MVAIQYMSDLHLERIKYDYGISKATPFLILDGDIGRFCDYDLLKDFLATQCDKFEKVLYVPGNHEFYSSSREGGLVAADSLVKEPSMNARLYVMNRERIDLPDSNATVLGCTLHSQIPPDYTRLTRDFEQIKGWRVAHHNAEHQRDLAWLKLSLAELSQESPKRNVVIATHYAPSFDKVCHPQHKNNAVQPCFSSHTLEQLPSWKGSGLVTHWIFGHTHWNAKFKAGKVTVASNQLCNDSHQLSWWQKRSYHPFDPEATIVV